MDDLFLKYVFEADEDPPEPAETTNDPVPIDEPEDNEPTTDADPPDVDDTVTDDEVVDSENDMMGMDQPMDDPIEGDMQNGDSSGNENLMPDDKIELILKKNLYNHYLALIDVLNDIEGNFMSNNDMIYSKSKDASELLSKISTLKNNVITYTALYFMGRSYSASMLLYNKIKAYLSLILDKFDKLVKKAEKE